MVRLDAVVDDIWASARQSIQDSRPSAEEEARCCCRLSSGLACAAKHLGFSAEEVPLLKPAPYSKKAFGTSSRFTDRYRTFSSQSGSTSA